MKIEIRHSEPEDYKQVSDVFSAESVYSGTLQLPYASAEIWKNRLLLEPENGFSLVAEIDGKIVGNCGLVLFPKSPRRRHAAYLGMAVQDKWQGKGVGSALLQACLDQADNWLNLKRIELTVFMDNEAGVALYQKFGFVTEGTLVNYAFQNGSFRDVYSMARIKD